MKCSICGSDAIPGVERCPGCGCRIPEASPTPLSPFDPNYVRPVKQRKTWLWIMIPLVFVCVLTVSFFAFCVVTLLSNTTAAEQVRPAVPSVPDAVQPDASLPAAPVSEDCFVVSEGVLMFLADKYDGGPVLQIPSTVGGETVTIIGAGCFRGCDDLTTIVLPNTVTAIQPEAFSGCTELRGLFVPEGTEYIGKDAFAGCVNLECVYIPASVTRIASGVFDDCAALMYIFYNGMFEDWDALYSDYIMPYTYAICLDGEYCHAAQ